MKTIIIFCIVLPLCWVIFSACTSSLIVTEISSGTNNAPTQITASTVNLASTRESISTDLSSPKKTISQIKNAQISLTPVPGTLQAQITISPSIFFTPSETATIHPASTNINQTYVTPAHPTKTPLSSSPTQTIPSPDNSGSGKQVIFIQSNDMGSFFYIKLDYLPDDPWLKPEQMISEGATTSNISIANFHDRIAYIEGENIKIADLSMHDSIDVYTITSQSQADTSLVWTPDDQHLILDSVGLNGENMIYHIQTGHLEMWNYQCDRLAISPRTQKIAIWCVSQSNQHGKVDENLSPNFAVIEWGGEIWITDKLPAKEIIRIDNEEPQGKLFKSFRLYRYTGWSSDGTRVAFFNPQDEEGALWIANTQGEILSKLSGKAYWFSGYYQMAHHLPGMPIQWSKNGERLLIYAMGDSKKPCPDDVDDQGDYKVIYPNAACWQVFDFSQGKTVWQITDMVTQNENPIERPFGTAGISSDGLFLAIYSFVPADIRLFVIEVNTNNILLSPPFRVTSLRWGSNP